MLKILNNGKMTSNSGLGGSYSGEKDMGDLNNWRILSSDSNDILKGSYNLLSTRSSTLYHTYPPVKGAINKQSEYGIGPGLVFKSQPDYKFLGMTKESAVAWGKDFQKIVHYYQKMLNFYEKQSVLFTTSLTVGDSLLFFLREKGRLTDLIESSGNQIDSKYVNANHTLGIKHDEWLRRQGIRTIKGKDISFTDPLGDQNVTQLYFKTLARQLRGYPLAYTIINLARNDDTHSDAITHRAVMEAVIMGIFKSNGTDAVKQAQNLALKNKKAKTGNDNATLNTWEKTKVRLGSGNIWTVNSQEDFEFLDMKTPSNGFKDFKTWILNYVAMATGTPPEVIMSRYESSFTAHKGALNDFVKSYMKKRRTFERIVMDTVIREIAKDAISQGLISAPGFFEGGPFIQMAYLQGMYLGPVPGHINPLVEVKADKESVNNEFTLRSDIASKNGHEWDIFSEEWAQEQKKFTDSPQDFVEKVFTQETEGGNSE
jgi:hypothetical protein